MYKPVLYLDTSVIGGAFDAEFQIYSRAIIRKIMDGFMLGAISNLTLEELIGAPHNVRQYFESIPTECIRILPLNDDVEILAQAYLDKKILSMQYSDDALHIAIATYYKTDVLISWNFKHIVNYNKIKLFNAVNMEHGFQPLEIRSPMEFTDE